MDNATLLPEATLRQLLSAVYAQAKPLIAELTQGKDWEESIYHFFFYDSPKEQAAALHLFEISWSVFHRLQDKPEDDKSISPATQALPPTEVLAYFDVYKRWPQGYPPKKEDYLV